MNIYQGVPGPPKRREAELLVESVHGRRREGTNIDLLGKGGPGPSPVGMGSPVGGGIGSLPSAMVPTAPTPAPTPGKVGMGASVLSEKDDEDEAAEPSVSNSHKPGVAQAHLVRSADESIPGSTMSGLMRSGTHPLPAYTTESAVRKLTRRLIKEDWTAWNELRAKSKVADMKGPMPGGDVWVKGKGWLGRKDKTRKTSKTTGKSNVTTKTPKSSQGGYRYTIGDQVLKPSPGTGFHGTR